MGELSDPKFVQVSDSVDRVTDLALDALSHVDDDEFVSRLWREFDAAYVRSGNPQAGLLHMAMSCYKLALAHRKIDELEEKLKFHREAIEFMGSLNDL